MRTIDYLKLFTEIFDCYPVKVQLSQKWPMIDSVLLGASQESPSPTNYAAKTPEPSRRDQIWVENKNLLFIHCAGQVR